MDWSMPGFPVLHYLPEFAQTHVHWVSDAIQPSHSLSPPSPLLSLSQYQDLYQWVSSLPSGRSIRTSASASVLPMNIQGWFPFGLTGLVSSLSKGLSVFFFSTTVWKHQFSSTQPSLWSNSHICTQLLEKPWLWVYRPLSAKWCFHFLICCLGLSQLFFKVQASFNFMAAVTICSDFGAQKGRDSLNICEMDIWICEHAKSLQACPTLQVFEL